MRKIALGIAVLVVAALPAGAGVVITQEDTAPDGRGGTVTTTRTVEIEGAMQRVSGAGDVVQILDAEAGTMTTLDPRAKTAMQMNMSGMGAVISTFMAQAQFDLKPTGGKKTIAGHACEEYQGSGKGMMGEASVVQCISKNAPGVAEYVAFHKKMMAKMGVTVPGTHPEGIVLHVETTNKPGKMAIPGMPPELARQLEAQQRQGDPQVSRTEVKSIRTQALPPETFTIPEDYEKQDMGDVMKRMR